tara:strand:+ start:2934 stop:3401 length:468 start_codon:yes stop_codon:yes gene_type:complete
LSLPELRKEGAAMFKCIQCEGLGYCQQQTTTLIQDQDLANPAFLADIRKFANQLDIASSSWREFLADLYCQYLGCIVDASGQEVFLDMEVFEERYIREWFRDWACTPPKDGTHLRLRSESRERIRVLATILRAYFPAQAMMWGIVPANDNDPIEE